ncbi:MAG: amino acid adenylation domain-containing protein, partial [Acidobacteriota bacterium]
ELKNSIETDIGVSLAVVTLLEDNSISQLANQILDGLISEISSCALPMLTSVIADRDSYPLSHEQLRMWFLDQLEPGNIAYNLPVIIRLDGQLELATIVQTCQELVRRHEIFRTTFATDETGPVQIIAQQYHLPLLLIDLVSLPEQQRQVEAQRIAIQEGQWRFDLFNGPLIRVSLLRLSSQQHLLLFILHRIVCDGYSLYLILQEMAALYQACTNGKAHLLPLPERCYKDFACWQNQWLNDMTLASQILYWKEQLAGAAPSISLPSDYSRPPLNTFSGARRYIILSKNLTETIKATSHNHGVTPFMTLLAVTNIFLANWSGQRDLVVGTVITNRNRPEAEKIIGDFTNFLPLRTVVPIKSRGLEYLKQVKTMVLQAYANVNCPFEKIVEAVKPERAPNSNPLYNAGLLMHNFHSSRIVNFDSRVTAELELIDNKTAELDLMFEVAETSKGLIIECEYSTDLFDQFTIDRMLAHIKMLLESFVIDPQQYILEMPYLTEAERHQLMVEWNNTEHNYQLDLSLHQLVAVQAEHTPDAIAVISANGCLSYLELNRRANQLAHYLQKMGIGRESLVGICVERSLEMVVGLLGILKAGGAFVPLDPHYPKERLAFMVSDIQANVLLTQGSISEELSTYSDARMIRLDTDWQVIAQESIETPDSKVLPDNLAYVIYTSGSTGKPKGAMNTHRGICNRLLWMQQAYRLTAEDRVLQKTSFSFDVSVWEFFWPLMTGACLIMTQPGEHKDTTYLVKAIIENRVTTVHFVPSMLRVFLTEKNVETCTSLKRVICSGEALSYELQQQFLLCLKAELHNLYGPTEAAIDVTYWACQQENERHSVPIGYPIANIQTYILDSYLRPVPIGCLGELHIGGAGIARGYHGRAELTAEKFIPNPFSHEPGARLYRTGDLVRYWPSGEIDFLGRIDRQVKIRGFRVELGEIEVLLREHPAVREAIVTAQQDQLGNTKLVAYLVSTLSLDDKWLNAAEETFLEMVDCRTRALRLPTKCECMVESDGETFLLELVGISLQGLCLQGGAEILIEKKNLSLQFTPPGLSRKLQLRATVVWSRDGAAGVKLQTDSEEQALMQQSMDHIIVTSGLSIGNLHSFLSGKLPEYMLPSAIVLLDRIPYSPSGKVNYRALPSVERERSHLASNYVMPRNPVEMVLADIWAS